MCVHRHTNRYAYSFFEHLIKLQFVYVAYLVVDIISAIEFDKTGEHLATGDQGGRVVLFQRTDGKDVSLDLKFSGSNGFLTVPQNLTVFFFSIVCRFALEKNLRKQIYHLQSIQSFTIKLNSKAMNPRYIFYD